MLYGQNGEKLAGTIQELQRDNLSVLIAESDVKRLSFAETVYTIERGAIVQAWRGHASIWSHHEGR